MEGGDLSLAKCRPRAVIPRCRRRRLCYRVNCLAPGAYSEPNCLLVPKSARIRFLKMQFFFSPPRTQSGPLRYSAHMIHRQLRVSLSLIIPPPPLPPSPLKEKLSWPEGRVSSCCCDNLGNPLGSCWESHTTLFNTRWYLRLTFPRRPHSPATESLSALVSTAEWHGVEGGRKRGLCAWSAGITFSKAQR